MILRKKSRHFNKLIKLKTLRLMNSVFKISVLKINLITHKPKRKMRRENNLNNWNSYLSSNLYLIKKLPSLVLTSTKILSLLTWLISSLRKISSGEWNIHISKGILLGLNLRYLNMIWHWNIVQHTKESPSDLLW